MRKTLTVIFALAAAASLAACKPFWEHDPKPPAVATTTEPTSTDPTATAGTSAATEQTASTSTDKPVAPVGEKTETPPVPATK